MEAPSSQANSTSNKKYPKPKGRGPGGPRRAADAVLPSEPAKAPPAPAAADKSNKFNKPVANKPLPKDKLVIRKLPASREFTRELFESCLQRTLHALGLDAKIFHLEHFIEGKISRKRGPIYSAGFISVADPSAKEVFLSKAASAPFLPDDSYGMPEVTEAPFNKVFKKDKPDKLAGSYETDPEYLAFLNPAAPAPRAPAGPVMSLEEKMRNNPLLTFMRERAERRRGLGGGMRDRDSKKKGKVPPSAATVAAGPGGAPTGKKGKKYKEKKEKKGLPLPAGPGAGPAAAGAGGPMGGEGEKKPKRTRTPRSSKYKTTDNPPVPPAAAGAAQGPAANTIGPTAPALGPIGSVQNPRKILMRAPMPMPPAPMPMALDPPAPQLTLPLAQGLGPIGGPIGNGTGGRGHGQGRGGGGGGGRRAPGPQPRMTVGSDLGVGFGGFAP